MCLCGWELVANTLISTVVYIDVVSNVHLLCTTYSWLHWLCELPDIVVTIHVLFVYIALTTHVSVA